VECRVLDNCEYFFATAKHSSLERVVNYGKRCFIAANLDDVSEAGNVI